MKEELEYKNELLKNEQERQAQALVDKERAELENVQSEKLLEL